MARLVVEQPRVELWIFAQRLRDRAQTADVLGMSPTRVVATAIGVRDESDGHRSPRNLRDVHSTRSRRRMNASSRRGSTLPRDAIGEGRGGPSRPNKDASGASNVFTSCAPGAYATDDSTRDHH